MRVYIGWVSAVVLVALAPAAVRYESAAAHVSRGALEISEYQKVAGRAQVVDGDTVDVAGQRIRLEGIDAPEAGQRCPGQYFGTWRCGRSATRKLKKLIGNNTLTCLGKETGRYGRLIATCYVGKTDVNAEMVRSGHAWAFVKYSRTYVAQESEARRAKSGLWSSRKPAQPAWDYRQRHWAKAEVKAPEGCAIKGNISARGERIYHAPWSPWYDRVRINAAKGERWFCSEGDAKAAGWRRAS